MIPVAGLLLGEGDQAKEQVMLLLAETVLNLLPYTGNALGGIELGDQAAAF